MYKITFPEGRTFTGVYLSVPFRDGQGETDSDYLVERFRGKGLIVENNLEEPEEDNYPPMLLSREELEKLPVEQLANYAQVHQVDTGKATSEKGILEKIAEAGKVFVKIEE